MASILSSYGYPKYIGMHFFFFNDTATTEIYTLSLHDALPICTPRAAGGPAPGARAARAAARTPRRGRARPRARFARGTPPSRSEEHTSELQSRPHLVCRLLLEKKKVLQASPAEHKLRTSRTMS